MSPQHAGPQTSEAKVERAEGENERNTLDSGQNQGLPSWVAPNQTIIPQLLLTIRSRHSTARHCAARRVTPRLQTGRLRPPSKQRPLLLVLPSCCPSRGRCPFVYIRRIKLSLRGIRCPFTGFDVPSRDSMSLRGIQVSIRRIKLSLRGIRCPFAGFRCPFAG
jgi:hypothetical protein